MINIALYQPEIPPNTGNVIRLCANTGFRLHLVKPLGFSLDDKRMRRAGLDYHEYADLKLHDNYEALQQGMKGGKIYALSTKGTTCYTDATFQPEDLLLFGPETRGLPTEILESLPPEQVLRLPMLPDSRSLNLSNTVSIVAYEAWRQMGFAGGKV
ncbi:tRNA (uridine(34)/cytosine(34)/5-carboxymethylaminomethyluridine(34)-2'-O)-methyltransferase TrmL [Endozoicomonadaceae bacterium StTr2]